MPRVLLIEDEAVLRSSMARALRKAPGLDVDEAATVDEALPLLDAAAPDIVLSDLDLPGRSGIEILGELGRRKIAVPVVFISAYLKAYGALIPRHANVEVREKPVGIDELRQLVAARVSAREKAHDSSPFSAADFVQLACMGRHSVAIELKRSGRAAGAIRVYDGEIWSASDDEGSGTGALRRVLFSKDGLVTCRTLFDSPGPRELSGAWQELLLEAARLEDEDAATDGAAPGASPAEATSSAGDPRAFEALFDEGVSALLKKDYVSALRSFRRAGGLRPGDGKVEANLARLHDMGIVDPDTGV